MSSDLGEMTVAGFDYFVVLAGMRTGSNLLEEYLSAMPGLRSYGELFNPHFFGKPGRMTQFGLSLAARDDDPLRVLGEMQEAGPGLPGFRLFQDHDSRVIDHVLRDRKAAKIVLARRPIDSYVSLKIARRTGQWWLGDMASARAAKVTFDEIEYADFVNTLSDYQQRIRHVLQITGQTAFHVDYAELSDSDVIAGLGLFLGAEGPPNASKVRAKVQNPGAVTERLTNPATATDALARLAATDPGRLPSHEPDRGPGLRLFHVCASTPLVYAPIRGAGDDPVPDWMRRVDSGGQVDGGLTQKDHREWMRRHPGHRSFTVLRHPLPRAHDAFCRFILPAGVDGYDDIRAVLTERYGVALPPAGPDEHWTADQQTAGLLGFLKFLKGNLGGQTSVRVDYSWASQAAYLQAIAGFAVPDRVVREDSMADELREIAATIGLPDAPPFEGGFNVRSPFPLEIVCTPEIEAACEAAYRRDYILFGFGRWRPTDQAA